MGVDCQRHAPAALPPGKTLYPLYRRLGGPQGRSRRMRKISPRPLARPDRISYAETASPVPTPFRTALRNTKSTYQIHCFSTVCVTTIIPLSATFSPTECVMHVARMVGQTCILTAVSRIKVTSSVQ